VLLTWPLALRLPSAVPAGADDLWSNVRNSWWWERARAAAPGEEESGEQEQGARRSLEAPVEAQGDPYFSASRNAGLSPPPWTSRLAPLT
jgi:hypothetical protein